MYMNKLYYFMLWSVCIFVSYLLVPLFLYKYFCRFSQYYRIDTILCLSYIAAYLHWRILRCWIYQRITCLKVYLTIYSHPCHHWESWTWVTVNSQLYHTGVYKVKLNQIDPFQRSPLSPPKVKIVEQNKLERILWFWLLSNARVSL